jgi:CubicO group peptidase (beta-lactamase class C family)
MIQALRQRAPARSKSWLLILTAALVAACSSTSTAPSASRGAAWPTMSDVSLANTGFDAAGLAKLDARMKEAVDKGEVSGIVTLLARHGQVAQFTAHGVQAYETGTPMTEKSLFRIYSMTKPITGVAMMQLYEKGLWELDDPVTKFVPEFANLQVLKSKEAGLVPANRPPTMKELMTHTAGFGYGLSQFHPVDQMFAKENPLESRRDDRHRREAAAARSARHALVVFDRGRHSRRDCRASLGQEIRRVPEAEHLHAAVDE